MIAITWTLAAAVEVALLVAVGFAGFGMGDGGLHSWLVSLASVGVVIAVWGLFVAPRAPHRLRGAALLVVKTAIFAVGAAAVYVVWGSGDALVFGAAALAYLGLALRLRML